MQIQLMPMNPETGFRMPNYWVWCGSVIRDEDGRYHMFASRWPKNIPFHPGWLLRSEVVRAASSTPEGPYNFEEIVLPARGAEYWDGCMTHNPMIMRKNGKYLLYYTGSTHPFSPLQPGENAGNDDPRTTVARANKRTGLAVADSVYGPWTRYDDPILPARPGTFFSYLTSNACPVFRPDGSVYLIFKSRQYDNYKHSGMMIGAAEAKNWQGPYRVITPNPIFSSNTFGEVEDPFVWQDARGQYHLIAKDMEGTIGGEKSAGILAHSSDGIHWLPDKHPRAYSRTIRKSDGTEVTFALLERPFLLLENGQPKCLFAAVADQFPYNNDQSVTWNQAFVVV